MQYARRGPYSERLVIEIFGEYLFGRDMTQPGYKVVNACRLAVPIHARSMFFKLVLPMGRGNYNRLLNWLFDDTVMLTVNKANLKKFDRFTEEQILLILAEYDPTEEEIGEFRKEAALAIQPIVYDKTEDVTVSRVRALLALKDWALSKSQLDWLSNLHYPTRKSATQTSFV